jgi:hypothetical protein
MPDAETLKLLAGPVAATVVLAIACWKLWARVVDLQDKRDGDNKVLVDLVKEQTKAQMEDAAAARELAQAVRASGRIAT